MQITITIDADHAAFSDGAMRGELSRLCAQVSDIVIQITEHSLTIEDCETSSPLIDLNGNSVGTVSVWQGYQPSAKVAGARFRGAIKNKVVRKRSK